MLRNLSGRQLNYFTRGRLLRGCPFENSAKAAAQPPALAVFSDPTAEKQVWSGSGAMPGLSASGW
jgi:DNA-binding protein H-NS